MLETVADYIEQHRLLPDAGTVVVAVSGGADSLCLLHLLNRLCGSGKRYAEVSLHVAHLNHRLRGEESERDAAHVEQVARAWGMPVTVGVEDVPALARAERLSLEEAARIARYRFLREVARGQRIAVAHHADDQVETLLLHLLRGGGLSSMVGMLPRREDIIRPLLAVPRSAILAYCRKHGIVAMEDSSNTSPHYLRNRIRHELLPLMESMNPGIRATLLRNAEVVRVDEDYIEEQVDAYWSGVVIEPVGTDVSRPRPARYRDRHYRDGEDGCDTSVPTDDVFTVNIPALLALPLSLQRHVLRRITVLLCEGQSPLEPRHYALIEQFLYNTNNGEQRSLDMPDSLRLTRVFDRCQFFRVHEMAASTIVATAESAVLPVPGSVIVPGTHWRAIAQIVPDDVAEAVGQAIACDDWARVWQVLPASRNTVYLDSDTITVPLLVRTRRAGDRIRPLGMAHEKKVQDILVDAHVARAERDTIPLFFAGEQCIWLAGLCLAESVKLTATTQRVVRLKIQAMTNETP